MYPCYERITVGLSGFLVNNDDAYIRINLFTTNLPLSVLIDLRRRDIVVIMNFFSTLTIMSTEQTFLWHFLEASASELLENHEEMFPQYYMHSAT